MPDPDDLIDLLVADHRRMDELLEWLDRDEEPAGLRHAFLEFAAEMSVHEAVEQQVIFPALKAAGGGDARHADARLGEHAEVDELLHEMRTLDVRSAGFIKRASALLLDLQNHFAAEEEDAFPRLRALVSPAEMAELGARAEAVRNTAPVYPAALRAGTQPT